MLHRAYELHQPILLLRNVRDGVFVPHTPVFVVRDLIERREFLLALDESVRFLGDDPSQLERRHTEQLVRQRLHQAEFCGPVIATNAARRAICRLRHGELLDAAHIVPDRDELGLPESHQRLVPVQLSITPPTTAT